MTKPTWKTLSLAVLAPVLAAGTLAVVAAPELAEAVEAKDGAKVAWQTDLSAARGAGEPVLAYFTADWCPPCQQMKKTTWVDPAVVEATGPWTAVKLDIDLPENRPFVDEYQVEAIPTVVLLSPEGEELARHTGYLAPEKVTEMLAKHGG